MRVAIIDLGTNTFHLIIAEIEDSRPRIIYKTNEPVKLGEDLTKDNCIIPAAFKRGLACLTNFKATIDFYAAGSIKAVATSGVRSATNGQEFTTAVKTATGIAIETIDGDKEAGYIYEGVKWSGAITGLSLIMDIGGGSTEFILCDKEKLFWKKSYPIGAARLMQLFFKSDPINPVHQAEIQLHLDLGLEELLNVCSAYRPQTLIGSAGAFETFAGMLKPDLDFQQIKRTTINRSGYLKLSETLISSSHSMREKMPGLIPLRVDMIVMACITTNYIIEKLNIRRIRLSTYDLKMGVLASMMNL